MPQSDTINRQGVLNERPVGEPTDTTLRLEEKPVPQPGAGQMLLRTEYMSLDPYMRGRMSDAPSYAAPVEIGDPMVGGTVAQVVSSHLDGYAAGDWVLCGNGWQDYALSDGTMVQNLGKSPKNPSWALGILGMPGFTAWAGLTQIGEPKEGETLVVAAATGPVGATVGQIAKIKGLRVVGVAGGAEKCAYAMKHLGFDACIDHTSESFKADLRAAVPDGIDIYFENVGGHVFDSVLPLLNPFARVPVCGLIASYNATELPPGPDRMGMLMGNLLRKKIRMQGFIIFDNFGHLYPQFAKDMQGWLAAGQMHYKEDMIEGFENAPAAFVGLLRG